MAASEAMGMAGSATKPGPKERDQEDLDTPRALGRYLLLRRIARGGMGEVFLASTTGLEGAERPVVVKIIRREHAKDPSFIARFLDEARVQAQLMHSGVAQVLDAAIDEATGEPYAAVEFVEGRSLGDVRARAIQIGHAIGWDSAVAIATLVAEALAHVHERQDAAGRALDIVHRDLSPQNVMIGYAGDGKIIDFGTARGQNRRCHTVSGVVFAKPGYTAPEVANGDSGDARVDIYALGVMLWELCAGRRFLQGDAAVHMAAVARNAKSPPPIAASCGAPPELDAIIAKLCAFDRDARYLTSRTAASDLARLLTAAAPLPTGERGVRSRVAHLMATLFPGEPGRTRREFARLVAAARDARGEMPTPKRAPSAPPSAPEAAPVPEAGVGDVLAGTRYKLVRELGRGASSVVYEAEHLDLGRRAALKVIGAEHGRSPELAARFRREARALSRLSHEGLVRVDDVGQAADGRLFCVMELLSGETLEARIGREKTLPYRDALRLADQALAALEAAHAAGLVHRDIKPANLFLPASPEGAGGVKLLDFGLARGLEEGDGERRAGLSLFGTPEYMAPEQAAAGTVDARADLYALGCVLYEMVTGRLPFPGKSSVAIVDAKVKGSPERMRARTPAIEIPEAVDDLVMKALARHPAQRFQTATEMRQAIRAVIRAPARQRWSRLVAGAALLAVTAFAAVAVAGKGKPLQAAAQWIRAHRSGAAQVDAAPAAPALPVAVAADPPREATPTEDGFDDGEDGDLVDDTPPAAPPASAAPSDPAPAPTVTPAAPAPDPAQAKKQRKHKRPAKARVAASGDDDAAQKGDAGKGDKARKKRKKQPQRVDL
jgi:serine/threonine-protein kinase